MKTTLTSPADAPADLIDVLAVGQKLNCSIRHVYRLADAGKMPASVRLGSLVRWRRSAIKEWIAAGCPSCAKGDQR